MQKSLNSFWLSIRAICQSFYVFLDYSILLPLLAHLPINIGRKLASLRGALYFRLKRDWRTFTFGDTTLSERTSQAFRRIFPQHNEEQTMLLTKQRFIAQSHEEYEAALIIAKRYERHPVDLVNADWIHAGIEHGEKFVFATVHFGSIVGLTNLSKFNQPLIHIASNITENPQLHPSIRRFYAAKYKRGNDFMNGGAIVDAETQMKRVLKFFKDDGLVSAVADIPALPEERLPNWQVFFGSECAFSPIIERLAHAQGAKIVPYVCYLDSGRYKMVFGGRNTPYFAFFEEHIRLRPGLWWAADLLPNYRVKD